MSKPSLSPSSSPAPALTAYAMADLPALNLKNDYWFCLKRRQFKKLHGVWLLELVGPAANLGRWCKTDRPSLWKWLPHQPHHPLFEGESGSWFFVGRLPLSQQESWYFVSEKPHLYFQTADGTKFDKITTAGETLLVHGDSWLAQGKLDLVIQSWLMEYRFKFDENTTDEEKSHKRRAFFFRQVGIDESEVQTARPPTIAATTTAVTVEDPPKKKGIFKGIELESARRDHIQKMVKTNSEMTLWTARQEFVLKGMVRRCPGLLEFYDLILRPTPSKSTFCEKAKAGLLETAYVQATLETGLVFLCLKNLKSLMKHDRLRFALPAEMWSVQRRQTIRCHFTPNSALKVAISLSDYQIIVTGFVTDLSATGACLLFQLKQVESLQNGMLIKALRMNFESGELFCGGKIRWVAYPAASLPGTQMVKFGLEFLNLTQEQSEQLGRFVIERSYQQQKK